MCSITQIRELTGYSDSTIRGAIDRMGIELGVIESPEDMQQLRMARVVQHNTSKVTVIAAGNAVRLMRHYQVPGDTVAAVKAIRTDQPPPIRKPGSDREHYSVQSGSGFAAASGQAGTAPRAFGPGSSNGIGQLRWGTPRPAAPACTRAYVFPTTLPRIVLTQQQETELYGLDKSRMSAQLKNQVKELKEWSKARINTLRTNTYATASSAATLVKVGACVRAYLGYVAKYYYVPASHLELSEYKDPTRIMQFVAYLNARGAHKGHILNHMSIAKKINVYLGSGTPEGTSDSIHAGAMDTWLATLIHQYNLSEKNPIKNNFPEATTLWAWVDQLSDLALFSIDLDLRESGQLTSVTAQFVQDAVVASLVTGREVSPFRLDFLKNVRHPRHNDHSPCPDRDCNDSLNCIGNRVELRSPRIQVCFYFRDARDHSDMMLITSA